MRQGTTLPSTPSRYLPCFLFLLFFFFFFLSLLGSLVTRREAPVGLDPLLVAGWPTIFLQYFDAVGWVF